MNKTKQQKILIVDDSKVIRQKTKKIIQPMGYAVDTAICGEEGIAKILENNPDIVLLDIEMPDRNGLEVFKHIRSQSGYEALPLIIFFTTRSDKIMEGFKLGASDFIEKSLASSNPEEFRARIEAHLIIAELIRKNIELEKLNILSAANNSARHEILQPLAVINIELSTILKKKETLLKSDVCVDALESAQRAAKKIRTIVEGFANITTSETEELNGGGTVLSRSKPEKN